MTGGDRFSRAEIGLAGGIGEAGGNRNNRAEIGLAEEKSVWQRRGSVKQGGNRFGVKGESESQWGETV